MLKQKSFVMKPSEAQRKWFVVDATDMVVGRLATRIATILRGKHKPVFTPNTDTGDFVVVINAEKVKFTGNKWEDKNYYWHTPRVGGLKARSAKEQLAIHPELILMSAVKGMLPKGTLGIKQLTKLKVYTGAEHPHSAQTPEVLSVK